MQREQRMLMLLSEQQVNEMAGQAYAETLSENKKQNKLNQDAALLERLRTIAGRLIPHVGVFRPEATQWDWEVNVLADDQLNAFCMPGGKILFYSGIIERLQLTNDEIAAIMGHEMAHALREHGREAMSQAYTLQLGRNAAKKLLGVDEQKLRMADHVTHYALTLPHSRTKEVEADRMGLELMARAGYAPLAAISVWKKMASIAGKQPPEFMSTHPSHHTRIEQLQALMKQVEPLYQEALL